MATKVTDKVVTTNEDWVHIWVRSGTEHIRLTENAYNKALESARKNAEDAPKIGWFRRLMIKMLDL